ncbi:hypothetical protein P3X46_004725 [Hevea brasiliensis]|uniref:Reverse transcriptase zinc-binding domain-containing protein n=1 Tax=Hevea brasiliensis TaxID=3981 RepID=A0ABQ9N065_HEVBR|nr:hypothetical protein P3X46_004725 [Hevea brasiliensis]
MLVALPVVMLWKTFFTFCETVLVLDLVGWVWCPKTNGMFFFLSSNSRDWFLSNLRQNFGKSVSNWPIMFGITIWWLCKWQCSCIFSGLELPCDPTQFIALKVEEVLHAYLCLDKHHIPIVQKHLMVNWSIPPHKWVKLNSEGSVVNHLGATGDLLVILVSVLFLKLNFGAFFKVSTWHGI